MLVAFLLRRADERELGAILPIWSRWAALAVSALVLAGTVQALIEVATPARAGQHHLRPAGAGQDRALRAGDRRWPRTPGSWCARASRPADRPPMRRAVWAGAGDHRGGAGVSATLVQTTPARTAAPTWPAAEQRLLHHHGDQPALLASDRAGPGRAGQQHGAPVRVHAGQPAAAGGGVAGHRGPADGRDRADPGPVAAADRQPRHRRDQPARGGGVGAAGHRSVPPRSTRPR